MFDYNFEQYSENDDQYLLNQQLGFLNSEKQFDLESEVFKVDEFLFDSSTADLIFKQKYPNLCKDCKDMAPSIKDSNKTVRRNNSFEESNSSPQQKPLAIAWNNKQVDEKQHKELLSTPSSPNDDSLDMVHAGSEDTIKITEDIDYFKRDIPHTELSSFQVLVEIAEDERIKHSSKFKRFGRKEDRGKSSQHPFLFKVKDCSICMLIIGY